MGISCLLAPLLYWIVCLKIPWYRRYISIIVILLYLNGLCLPPYVNVYFPRDRITVRHLRRQKKRNRLPCFFRRSFFNFWRYRRRLLRLLRALLLRLRFRRLINLRLLLLHFLTPRRFPYRLRLPTVLQRFRTRKRTFPLLKAILVCRRWMTTQYFFL